MLFREEIAFYPENNTKEFLNIKANATYIVTTVLYTINTCFL
jgi:hypothetical protein